MATATSRVKVQVASDIHLEFRLRNRIEELIVPKAPVLILAGDISTTNNEAEIAVLKRFLGWASAAYKYVFYVPGNHEFYSEHAEPMPVIAKRLRALVKEFANIRFLCNNAADFSINGKTYRVVGSPLWVSYMDMPLADVQKIHRTVNDFTTIYSAPGGKLIEPTYVSAMHATARRFIKKKIDESPHPVIVVTHIRPLPPASKGGVIEKAYSVDMTALMTPKVALWAYGHTHVADDRRVGTTRVYSNPLGYPREPIAKAFKSSSTILL